MTDQTPRDLTGAAPKGDAEFRALAALAEQGGNGKAGEGQKSDKGSSGGTRRESAPRTAPLEKRLSQTFTTIAVVVSAFDPVCGEAVNARADDLAGAWNRLAQQNPRVKKAIESLLEGGAYGEALFVTAVTLLPILRHHGLLPWAVDLEGIGPDDIPDDDIPESLLTDVMP